MRTKGKITHWNEEKDYGFITPASGAKRVFVHLSAFSNSFVQPKVGQMVTFVTSSDQSGRPRAEDVLGEGETAPRIARRPSFSGRPGKIGVLLVILLIAAVVYSRFDRTRISSYLPGLAPATTTPPSPGARFHCDGRTHCSHMTSCEEATYFIQNCPNTKMDGDSDGVPCEKQWCG
jgi:cold shock CspA family protein